MMDEKELHQEVVDETQTNEQNPQQTTTDSSDQTGRVTNPTKEEHEARNFSLLREKALRAERERDEALRMVREMEAKKQSVEEDIEDINLRDDEIAEGKHLSKVQKQIKGLQNELKKYKQEANLNSVEAKIRSNYPDFDSVVSRENIESLRNSYPELAQVLVTSPDEYSKAASAYTLIKKLGIDSHGSYEMDKKRVQENASKPKPLASIGAQTGAGPLAHANAFAGGLTKELQQQLIKEMQDARKGF
jgi:hypothetical protein